MPERIPPALVELSTRFTGLAVEDIDGEIERALRQLVEYLDTDRSSFTQIEAGGRVTQTHTWVREGLPPSQPSLLARIPWYTGQLAAGQVVAFARLPDELPAEAAGERAYVEASGLKSIIAVPIALGGRYVCALSTGALREHRTWDEAAVDAVRLVAQVIANAVHRRQSEERLRAQLQEIRELRDLLQQENTYLREEVRGGSFGDVVGQSPALARVLEQVAQVAPAASTVLLLGETGTGKELLAQAIHDRSPRRAKPFIKVNCAALPATLIETELLGHEKGAFTGALATHPGRFELADGGTLFLDEIGDLAVELQSKLLRVLQDGEVQRLGATRPRKVDVRLVAATNQDLERAMAEGRFRRDLYYRLSVFPIAIPPLRERREDIPLIAWSFIEHRQGKLGRRIEQIPREVMDALVAYDWPGNVRELQNVLERAMILSPGKTLRLEDPLRSAAGVLADARPRVVLSTSLPAAAAPSGTAEDHSFDGVARDHVRAVLERCGWRINGPGGAAEVLAVHPNTLRSRMKRLGLERPQPSRIPR